MPFFDYVNQHWKHVFYVTGTKEYDVAMPYSKQHMRIKESLKSFPNVTLLDTADPHFYFPKENVAIIGSTLWSRKHTLYRKEKKELEKQVDFWTYQKANIVMLTHHMPSYKLISPRFNPPYNSYASNCESLMSPQVKAWIYGRTHNVSNIVIKNTLVVVNARGYPLEEVPGFTTEAFIELNLGPEEPIGTDIDLTIAATGIKL
jgi:hypothetical protein